MGSSKKWESGIKEQRREGDKNGDSETGRRKRQRERKEKRGEEDDEGPF